MVAVKILFFAGNLIAKSKLNRRPFLNKYFAATGPKHCKDEINICNFCIFSW
jgi:hypothetical protein